MCSCSLEVESMSHFFLLCLHYLTLPIGHMNKVNQIDENFSDLPDENKVVSYGTQDLITIKTISSYLLQLHLF